MSSLTALFPLSVYTVQSRLAYTGLYCAPDTNYTYCKQHGRVGEGIIDIYYQLFQEGKKDDCLSAIFLIYVWSLTAHEINHVYGLSWAMSGYVKLYILFVKIDWKWFFSEICNTIWFYGSCRRGCKYGSWRWGCWYR